MGSFCPKYKMHELKIYRWVMFKETKEWWKIWRGIDLLFQNWHKEFDKFWLKHLSLKNLLFNGLFLTKVYNVWLKKYRGVIFHDTRDWCKIWRKTDLWLGKSHEKFGKISPEHTEVSKLGFLLGLFIQSTKYISLKFTGELYIVTVKNDAKFEKGKSVQNWHEEFNKFWHGHSKISKICTLMGCLWPRYIIFELRKYRGVMFESNQDWYRVLEKTNLCFQKWHEEFGNFSPEH